MPLVSEMLVSDTTSRLSTDPIFPSRGTIRKEKKDESFLDKLGTLGRKKKSQQLEQEAENEAIEVETEGAKAIDSAVIPVSATLQNIMLEEGTYTMKHSQMHKCC
ncbi:unnamed protein product [Cercopithifilaria johnstoni]|uniref:Uncharacterized protein n=1 Tax=Cercopithifilaria johnstoni TaxID=2874296 RepID=A0A8J2Q532_9BILA|nr:unnamed protein product [Cercopithifilaria johnstoni]